ncbi:hypothetical protein TRSC58_07513 [Trypanosoma rangeli SC58]|uniref:Uncharacterized protein n=1 Tax=Trypanosoma rangeli SC58 TaxID=429131 RepID=A0A061IRK9_TRYRA|nr:hypothetical protein TRSC58_07513 [Trypanosoma rangeli SC58]
MLLLQIRSLRSATSASPHASYTRRETTVVLLPFYSVTLPPSLCGIRVRRVALPLPLSPCRGGSAGTRTCYHHYCDAHKPRDKKKKKKKTAVLLLFFLLLHF